MTGPRWLRFGSVLLVLLAACQPRTDQGYASARALAEGLREAGAVVEEAAVAAPPAFGAGQASAWRVNGELLLVYEFGDEAMAKAAVSGIDRQARTFAGEPLPWSDQLSLWSSGSVWVAYEGTDGGLILLVSGLLGDPLTVPTGIPQEPNPPAVTAALMAWAEALRVDPATIEVIGYVPAEWASSCLGLPAAGEMCAEVIVPGWQVDLRLGERTMTAHTDELGLQVRLAAEG